MRSPQSRGVLASAWPPTSGPSTSITGGGRPNRTEEQRENVVPATVGRRPGWGFANRAFSGPVTARSCGCGKSLFMATIGLVKPIQCGPRHPQRPRAAVAEDQQESTLNQKTCCLGSYRPAPSRLQWCDRGDRHDPFADRPSLMSSSDAQSRDCSIRTATPSRICSRPKRNSSRSSKPVASPPMASDHAIR